MKPQLSKWLVAPSPFLVKSQRAPIEPLAKGDMAEKRVMGSRQATWK